MSNLTDLVPIPANINRGLNGTSNRVMLSLLGSPRNSFSRDCQGPTNSPFKDRVGFGKDVGPFRVSGFDLAVQSLKEVMNDVKSEQAAVFDALGTAGMMCCRFVRGSSSSISNHSWGSAVDLNLDGRLDLRGNNKAQKGLTLIAPIFHRHGWFWGAGFPTEDSMHFEVSRQKMMEWNDKGLLFSGRNLSRPTVLDFGDRGNEVKTLQQRLNKLGFQLDDDGIFGVATRAAVIDFQSANSLEPDGIVGDKTMSKLQEVT